MVNETMVIGKWKAPIRRKARQREAVLFEKTDI